jgi:hypothetical protein
MAAASAPPAGQFFDRLFAMLAALAVVGVVLFLVVRNEPIADPRLFFILRVVLSFGAATLGATIPGFLDIKWARGGMAIRAGGALALFVVTYVYTPDLAPAAGEGGTSITQSSTGNASPPIVNNSGSVTIQSEKK